MDRDEAINLLRGGPDTIAEWNCRRAAEETIPSLCKADLSEADLSEIDLTGADLRGANLVAAARHHPLRAVVPLGA